MYLRHLGTEVELIEPEENEEDNYIKPLIDRYWLTDDTTEKEMIERVWDKLNEVISKINKED